MAERRGRLPTKIKPIFVEPVLLLCGAKLPEVPDWAYEIKLDGYRALAFKLEASSSSDPPRFLQAMPPLLDLLFAPDDERGTARFSAFERNVIVSLFSPAMTNLDLGSRSSMMPSTMALWPRCILA
jgi:hypothetical protein